ncbi:MAG: Ribosomal RNA large subunit methyltransferase K/L [Candidatus Izimaplasma bacterium HR2]|nr:MAG: Ribosomal RNA large subunit methyltransferase K/L [Candidatus Izimaplasma bacterium HR2]
MENIELIATATFGLEAVVKRELIALGFTVTKTENGKVTFLSDVAGIAKANLWLRTADRVLLKVGEFKAFTFDELFDKTNALDWTKYIPVDGKFTVNGKSVKSKLFSISDCQRIVKKSIVENMKKKYKVDWLQETGADYTVLVSLLKDVATLTIDTSGTALHKRGYRVESVMAPIKETLAAGMVLLSYWSKDRILYDVFCGSGTIPIEAALIGRNIAPGLYRDFASKHWPIIGESIWKDEIKEALKAINQEIKLDIYASDISQKAIEAAKENAEEAGVLDDITFTKQDFKFVNYSHDYGVIISNPPYGERIGEDVEIKKLYKDMGFRFSKLPTWSKYLITSFEDFEGVYRHKADRQRKLYNGKIETRYYQYYGPRPPREE